MEREGVSQPTPTERLAERLAHLPPDGIRALEAALDHAAARARSSGREWIVALAIEVSADGLEAIEVTSRYELDSMPYAMSGRKGSSPRQ
jgi:hypothetical protein